MAAAIYKAIEVDRAARLSDTPAPKSEPTPEEKAAFIAKVKASNAARPNPPKEAVTNWEALSKRMPQVIAVQVIESLSELIFHVLDGNLVREDIPPTPVELNLLCVRTTALSMLEQALTGTIR